METALYTEMFYHIILKDDVINSRIKISLFRREKHISNAQL